MFQTFSTVSDGAEAPERVKALRALLAKEELQAVIVPRGDEHQGEYVAPSSERLRFISGFTGSAGMAVIARKHAAVFADGRYTVQVKAECDGALFDFPGLARTELPKWIGDKLKQGDVVGFDPWLHTSGEIRRLTDALIPHGITLKPLSRNLVDVVWGKARPAPPLAPIEPHPVKYAGRNAEQKLAQVQKLLKDQKQDAVVLTSPDSICWLFNIRGRDVAHNPVVLAFAIVPQSGKADLFVRPEKVSPQAKTHLDAVATISAPDALKARLAELKAEQKRVRVDTERAAFWIERALGKSAVSGGDPIVPLKAIKTTAEIKGARAAHQRDGVAVVRFLSWLDREAAKGGLTEIAAVKELEAQRIASGQLLEISFDTIAGSGPNGAIVHYRVTEATNRKLKSGELFLVDSGAQYIDGTTDITRTVPIGQPSAEMRERYTLVLKGHIAIATAKFPKGTRGLDLDTFARRALWQHGLDFDHGTGHGVGSYLSVHEGPQSISRAGGAVIEPGMIISNEPGFYKEGAYGIRLENLVLVTDAAVPRGGDRAVMAFETLTLVPFDRRLIVRELLDPHEVEWLNAYHAHVAETLAPLIDGDAFTWLATATRPL